MNIKWLKYQLCLHHNIIRLNSSQLCKPNHEGDDADSIQHVQSLLNQCNFSSMIQPQRPYCPYPYIAPTHHGIPTRPHGPPVITSSYPAAAEHFNSAGNLLLNAQQCLVGEVTVTEDSIGQERSLTP